MAGPGDALVGVEDGNLGSGPGRTLHQGGAFHDTLLAALRLEPGAQRIDIGNGGRKTDAAMTGCEGVQPCQAKRQQGTALRRGEGMQLIDDHPPQSAEACAVPPAWQ